MPEGFAGVVGSQAQTDVGGQLADASADLEESPGTRAPSFYVILNRESLFARAGSLRHEAAHSTVWCHSYEEILGQVQDDTFGWATSPRRQEPQDRPPNGSLEGVCAGRQDLEVRPVLSESNCQSPARNAYFYQCVCAGQSPD